MALLDIHGIWSYSLIKDGYAAWDETKRCKDTEEKIWPLIRFVLCNCGSVILVVACLISVGVQYNKARNLLRTVLLIRRQSVASASDAESSVIFHSFHHAMLVPQALVVIHMGIWSAVLTLQWCIVNLCACCILWLAEPPITYVERNLNVVLTLSQMINKCSFFICPLIIYFAQKYYVAQNAKWRSTVRSIRSLIHGARTEDHDTHIETSERRSV